MSIECSKREHLECDGTTPASDVPGWWDSCSCECHPRSGRVIPAESIEEAAKIVADHLGYGWVNDEYREVARRIIEAVQTPLKADAYDEGYKAGTDELPWQNPYRPAP